jgi:hypothetical protein
MDDIRNTTFVSRLKNLLAITIIVLSSLYQRGQIYAFLVYWTEYMLSQLGQIGSIGRIKSQVTD